MASYKDSKNRQVGKKQDRSGWTDEDHEVNRRVQLHKKRRRDTGAVVEGVRKYLTIPELDINNVIFMVPESDDKSDSKAPKKDIVPQAFVKVGEKEDLVRLQIELGPFIAQGCHMTVPGRRTAKAKEFEEKYKITYTPDVVHPAIQKAVPNYAELQARAMEFMQQFHEKLLAYAKAHPETFASFRKHCRTQAETLYDGKFTKAERDEQEWTIFKKTFGKGIQKDSELSPEAIEKLKKEGVDEEDLLQAVVKSGIKADTHAFLRQKNGDVEIPEPVKARLLEDPTDEVALLIKAAAKAGYIMLMPRCEINGSVEEWDYFAERCRNLDEVQGIVQPYVYSEDVSGGWKNIQKELLVLIKKTYEPSKRVQMKPMVDSSFFETAPPDPFPKVTGLDHDVALFVLSKHEEGTDVAMDTIFDEFKEQDPTAVTATLDTLVKGDILKTLDGLNYTLVNPPGGKDGEAEMSDKSAE